MGERGGASAKGDEGMTDHRFPVVREAVASFKSRRDFDRAVSDLLAAGFPSSDISVLATHQSLEAARGRANTEAAEAGATEDVNYIFPITLAGIVALSGGPVAAAIGALVAAGLGGAALKDVLDRFTAAGHRDEIATALEAGALLLWARVPEPALEPTAVRILEENGGRFAHIHARHVEPGTPGAPPAA
jgi:hypothetical protein